MRLLLLVIFVFQFSFAHKLNLFLTQEKEKVFASAYFASGSFCKNCDIKVEDEKGVILQKGKTNKNGEFIITNLAPKIIVSVESLGGHGAKDTLKTNITKKENKMVDKNILNLEEEILRLKSENKMLKEKIEQNEILKMIFALFIIVGIFFFLKKIKRKNE